MQYEKLVSTRPETERPQRFLNKQKMQLPDCQCHGGKPRLDSEDRQMEVEYFRRVPVIAWHGIWADKGVAVKTTLL